jgi:hypothetical protein
MVFYPAGINGEDYALVSEAPGGPGNQVRILNSSGIYRNLVGAASQQRIDLVERSNAAAYGKGNKNIFSNLPDEVHERFAGANGSSNVEKYQFISAFVAVSCAEFHGVACVRKIQKIDAFNHAVILDIEAGNDSFCQHFCACRLQIS